MGAERHAHTAHLDQALGQSWHSPICESTIQQMSASCSHLRVLQYAEFEQVNQACVKDSKIAAKLFQTHMLAKCGVVTRMTCTC